MIPFKLKIFLLIITVLYFIIVLRAVKKETMPIKSSALWLIIGILMLLFLLFPEVLANVALLVGIKKISNLLLFSAVLALLMFAFDLYRINNKEKIKNIVLAQEIGLIKHELKNKR